MSILFNLETIRAIYSIRIRQPFFVQIGNNVKEVFRAQDFLVVSFYLG